MSASILARSYLSFSASSSSWLSEYLFD